MSDGGFGERLGRVEELVDQVEAGPDGPEKERVRDLVTAILELHREGLSRLLELCSTREVPDPALLRRLGDDALVSSVLALHGLHPIPVATRVKEAVDGVISTLSETGLSVEIIEATADRVELVVRQRRLALPVLPSAPTAKLQPPEQRLREAVTLAVPEVDNVVIQLPESVPRCELCRQEIAPEHEHLAEPAASRLICACSACCLVLGQSHGSRFRQIPRRRFPAEVSLTDLEWESLALPVNLVFFLKSSAQQRVSAFYPGPAGSTECLLSLDAWKEISVRHPELEQLEPDVEALLVHRVGRARDHIVLPIDACYRLVGLLRERAGPLSGPMATEVVGDWIADWRARSCAKGDDAASPRD